MRTYWSCQIGISCNSFAIAHTDLPAGVVNLVHGSKTVVDALLDHPIVKAISFVGSSPFVQYIYRRAAENGKRVQCQGGAKNPVVILPDADLEMTTRIVADSAFGCAGQRCFFVQSRWGNIGVLYSNQSGS